MTRENLVRRIEPLSVVEQKENINLEAVSRIAGGKRLMKEIAKSAWGSPPIHVVDLVSFWSHFSFFVLFNAIYWCYPSDKDEC